MSKKAVGSVINAPDAPVAQYSEEMESCFEMLHRRVWAGLKIPDSVKSIFILTEQLSLLYYSMRDYLENDNGISSAVVDALPEIEMGSLLKTLYAWESNYELGFAEYEKRASEPTASSLYVDPLDGFTNYQDCWKRYRMWMFEANRALTLARARIVKLDSDELSPPRRYHWLPGYSRD